MKKGKNLFILCSAAFCFTLALAGCQNANNTNVPSENEQSESQSGQETTTYTVKFNSNGGSAVADQKVKKGEKAKKPTDPTREGYSFVNWFQDDVLATEFSFDTEIVSDMTLYAKWDRNGDPGPGPGPQPTEYDYYFYLGTTAIGLDADSVTLLDNQTGQWSKSGVTVTAGQAIHFEDKDANIISAGSDSEDATHKNNVSGSFDDGYTIHNDATASITLKAWADGGYSFWITGYSGGSTPVDGTFYLNFMQSVDALYEDTTATLADNQTGQYYITISPAWTDSEFFFEDSSHNKITNIGPDPDDATHINNCYKASDDKWYVHNDATDGVTFYLKTWADGGHSFWVTGYEAGETPVTDYSVTIGADTETLTSIAPDATDPSNLVGKYQCQFASVSATDIICFYNGTDQIYPGSDLEDATNKNNVSGSYENGYTIHNDATDVYVTLKVWDDGYSFWITGYEAGSTPTDPYGPEGSTPVNWYIVGHGSIFSYDWNIIGGIRMYSNPRTETDLGCILNITFAVGDLFKITDDSTWYGYEKVDTWEDESNKGLSCFTGVADGYGGQNFKCTTAGTYDIYVNQSGNFWICEHAE